MPDDHDVAAADVADAEVFADLTDKERLFVEALADPESGTFGRRTASAAAAGYGGARSAAWKALKRPRVRQALAVRVQQAQRSLDFVMAEIEVIGQKAAESGDWSTALRAAELQAKRLGGFTERLMIGMDERESRRGYDAEEVEEAQRLSRLLLAPDADGREAPPTAEPAVPAEPGPSASQVLSGVIDGGEN